MYLCTYSLFPQCSDTGWLGEKKHIRHVKTGCLFAGDELQLCTFHSSIFTTISVMLSSNNIQSGEVLLRANPDLSGK